MFRYRVEPAELPHGPARDLRLAVPVELRPLDPAVVEGEGAAGVEGAAGRRIEGRGQFALQADAIALPLRIGDRRRRQQRLRIGMQRTGEQRVARRLLDDAAEIHHDDLVGHVADDRERHG